MQALGWPCEKLERTPPCVAGRGEHDAILVRRDSSKPEGVPAKAERPPRSPYGPLHCIQRALLAIAAFSLRASAGRLSRPWHGRTVLGTVSGRNRVGQCVECQCLVCDYRHLPFNADSCDSSILFPRTTVKSLDSAYRTTPDPPGKSLPSSIRRPCTCRSRLLPTPFREPARCGPVAHRCSGPRSLCGGIVCASVEIAAISRPAAPLPGRPSKWFRRCCPTRSSPCRNIRPFLSSSCCCRCCLRVGRTAGPWLHALKPTATKPPPPPPPPPGPERTAFPLAPITALLRIFKRAGSNACGPSTGSHRNSHSEPAAPRTRTRAHTHTHTHTRHDSPVSS